MRPGQRANDVVPGTTASAGATSRHVRRIPDTRRRRLAAAVATLLVTGLAVACASDDASGPGTAGLSAEVREGRDLYRARGCQGCHGGDGSGGIGPALAGIAGTERELVDGSVVIADTEYLRRSITDPDAEITAGYSVRMPSNNLDDDQVDALVAYIESLEVDP